MLSDELRPVEREIEKLLKVRDITPSVFRERVKVLPIARRPVPGQHFQIISEALLQERQVSIRYSSYNRHKTERDISPQTVIYYRENWYVDAWCHLRKELRTFHLSRIEKACISKAKRQTVPVAELEQCFAESYGLFAGKPAHTAKLRFEGAIAREIASQQWHPAQLGAWDGRDYLLTFPYSDDRELVQDILRHIPNVYVEAPVALRRKVQHRLQEGLGRFVGRVVKV
ncbi:MAG: WYL domain-containing protein [Pseudomonadota bacterium]